MGKIDIIDIPDFDYTPQSFEALKNALKAGKTVRNPFAKFYSEKIEVNVLQSTGAVAEPPIDYQRPNAQNKA